MSCPPRGCRGWIGLCLGRCGLPCDGDQLLVSRRRLEWSEAELAVDRRGALILSLHIAPSLLLSRPDRSKSSRRFFSARASSPQDPAKLLRDSKVATIPSTTPSPTASSARLVQEVFETPRANPLRAVSRLAPLFQAGVLATSPLSALLIRSPRPSRLLVTLVRYLSPLSEASRLISRSHSDRSPATRR